MLDDAEVRRVLAVVAHPDDIDFSAGGTIATFTDKGIEVVYCVVTDGDAGGEDRDVDHRGMAELRRAEQIAAGECLGVRDIRFLGYPDGRLEPSLGLRRDIARVIRQVRPDRVITMSPERDYERIGRGHPDHRVVGGATLDAVYPDARNPYAFPELLAEEGLEAWTVREVWLSGPTPNHAVGVTATVDRKIAALREHKSQTGHRPGFEDRVRASLAANAAGFGLPEGRYAELFQVVDTA